MRIFDCVSSVGAWAAWRACADAPEYAGARLVAEELRSEVLSIGPNSWFRGFARWNTAPDRARIAVVVEGLGWAVDEHERVVLGTGQGALWQPGEWGAFGADSDDPQELRRFCRMLLVGADALSLEGFVAGAGVDASLSCPRVVAEPATADAGPMQVFDCASAAQARACYDRYLAAEPCTERGMSRGGVMGGHHWNSDHLTVFMDGGWAADDHTRHTLRPGQGVLWPAGAWFACGSDASGERLRIGAQGLTVDTFLAAS